ncbi:hypothetical protein ABE530_11840 [Brucella sp. TWI559]
MRKTAAFISAYLIGMSAIVCMIAVSLYPTPSPAMPFSNPVMQAYVIADYDHHDMMAFPAVMTIVRQAEDLKPYHPEIRAALPLAPEYAQSLKSDALNFIETRLRC